MKRMLAVVAVCGMSWLLLAVARLPAATEQPATRPADGKLIVHEWGTFTGFAGSDGVHIPFGTLPGSDVPDFVITRREQAQRLDPKIDAFSLIDWGKGGGVLALQRMETPVIYFHAAQPRDVSVAVDFPHGLLTEFYPPVRKMTPAFGEAPGEPSPQRADGSPTTRPIPKPAKLDGGSLDWGRVRIIPRTAGEHPAHMPEVPKPPAAVAGTAANIASHYEYARDTDAATVQFSDRPAEQHDERFLFYRGLGDFVLPIALKARDDDHFQLISTAAQPIPFAVLLRMADGRAHFAIYMDVTGRQEMALPTESVSPDQVGEAIAQALMAQGLFEKEARAMVKTWSSNWLGDAGTRVLYAVPRPITDTLLPLRIAPEPDETVRVMVGRIDVLTPSQEARIQSLLSTSLKTKVIAPEDAQLLRNLGRFLDPALERASKLRANPDGQREVSALRWLYWNAPKPEQQQTAASATSH